MRNASRFISCGVLLFSWLFATCIGRAEDSLWQTDFAAAKAQAKAEHKLLLVAFGSPGCGGCVKLKKDVFDQQTFQATASKQFALVEVQYYTEDEQPKELKLQNDALHKEYKIHAFPTVFLLDSDGGVIARTGFRDDGPEQYLVHVSELIKLHEATLELRNDLAQTPGLERAKLLDRLIENYGRLVPEIGAIEGKWDFRHEHKNIDAWSHEIVALDADNQAGLKVEYQFRIAMAESKKLLKGRNDFEGAQKLLAQALTLPGLTDEQKCKVYLSQSNCFCAAGDPGKAIKVLAQVLELGKLNGEQQQHAYGQSDLFLNYPYILHDHPEFLAGLQKAIAAAPSGNYADQLKRNVQDFTELAVGKAKREVAAIKLRAELEKTTGPERLPLLNKVMEAYQGADFSFDGKDQCPDVEAWCREIVKLDADDAAGLGKKYEKLLRVIEIHEWQYLYWYRRFVESEALCDKLLKKPGLTPDELQNVYFLKASSCANQKHLQQALDCIQKGLELNPKGQGVEMLNWARQRDEEALEEQNAAKD